MNTSSPTIKRLLTELKNLSKDPDKNLVAGPIDDSDILTWHFTIKGPKDTPFEGGIYHGKIIFPNAYPMEPPDIIFLTPNGRFETNVKICLTVTSYHPDCWQPAWDVRTVLTSVMAFMPTDGEGAIGSLNDDDEKRRKYAIQSRA